MSIDIGPSVRIGRYDTILLASDGVFDNLRGEEITQAIRKGPLQAAAAQLFGLCVERMAAGGKPDDLSVLLYRSG